LKAVVLNNRAQRARMARPPTLIADLILSVRLYREKKYFSPAGSAIPAFPASYRLFITRPSFTETRN
jgi:hypothetical protein